MAKLICHNSVPLWEHEQVSRYPEIKFFIKKLKNNIIKNPDGGSSENLLSISGKTIPFRKQSVKINLFSYQYAHGYSFITASYLYNNELIYLFNITFT